MRRVEDRKSFARAGIRVALAIALLASVLTVMATAEPGGADCPVPQSGHWQGTWASTVGGPSGTIQADLVFNSGTLTGSVALTGGPYPGANVNGSYSCATITVGTLDSIATFSGTIDPDGMGMSGTYTAGADSGTWSDTFVPLEEPAIEVSQTVQPTSIGSGAAASWVISVTNPTEVPVNGVVAVFDAGAGTPGDAGQFETSTGGFCEVDVTATCAIGIIQPGETETASGAVVAAGIVAPASFDVSASAYFDDDSETTVAADDVTVHVVGSAQLPPGTASGVATPGQTFQTSTSAPTPELPIRVQIKLPKKVAAGTTATMALGGRSIALVAARPATLLQAAVVSAPPVPMSLSTTADEASTFCDGPCSGDVINVSPFSHYNDPKRPAKLTITWDATRAGNGVNSRIYKRGDSKQSPRTILPACLKVKKVGYGNLPCVFKRKQAKSGDVQFTILLLSGDPKFGRR